VERSDGAPDPSGVLHGAAVLESAFVRELLVARLVGVLATLDPDGSPHVVPMWVAPRTDDIVMATSSRSRKVRNLGRDPRATLVVHDSRPGSEVCGFSVRGRVDVVAGDAALDLAEFVHRRYLSEAGRALPETREFLAFDDVALVLRPDMA